MKSIFIMLSLILFVSCAKKEDADINKIVVQFRRQEDRLGDLIQIIAQSEIFNSR